MRDLNTDPCGPDSGAVRTGRFASCASRFMSPHRALTPRVAAWIVARAVVCWGSYDDGEPGESFDLFE